MGGLQSWHGRRVKTGFDSQSLTLIEFLLLPPGDILIAAEMRLSGLQREVLHLYRQCLREAGKKPEVSRRSWHRVHRTSILTTNRLPEKISRRLPGQCQFSMHGV